MPAPQLTPGFMVIHGNQPELLRQLLVHWFKAHPLAPLENEAVLVQSNGIAQWLKMALAANANDVAGGGCGIAAALDMLLPSRFIWQAYRAVLGPENVPATSPFDKSLLLWRLLRLLPGLCAQPAFEPLARFLEDDGELRKRYQLAEKIADLFDQYQVYRADWLAAWASGQDVLLDLTGQARPLPPAQRWQAMLWRALLADVGADEQHSRATVHQRFLAAVAGLSERPAGLPRRVSVFGLSSLPEQSLEVLREIARFTQVILCVHNPCQHYWADLLSAKDLARQEAKRHKRKQGMPENLREEDLHYHAHPLLAAWGKQGRDYIRLLDSFDDPEKYAAAFTAIGESINLFGSHGGNAPSLLQQVQNDILDLKSTVEISQAGRRLDPARDDSIRFHIAHSLQREVEILHDQLLAAFDADPALHPRDVIVMVPDVNAYAPHVEAVFGQIDTVDRRHIPFSIADQTQRQQAPLAFALEFLLGVPESRLAVSDLLDLLDVPAVRQRLQIAEDELPLLRRWIEQTHIRWGLDGEHRAQFIGQKDTHNMFAQNTWQHGLQRMLLGYAVGGDPAGRTDEAWHDIEPYGEIAGLDAALLGPLARLLDQLDALARELARPATPAVWFERLQTLLQDFFLCETAADIQLLEKLQNSLQDWRDACSAAALEEAIPLAVVREHWLAQIDQAGLARRFQAGRLTFATLMPMRAIPFKMVCLLGMNDGEFPRSRPPVDFDLMARDNRPGDRSRREDDRYLFLEALLSARQRLHISWVGRSIQDNTERPPSVLVSQLRDHLASGWRLAGGGDKNALLAALTVAHRLQPFSPAYFRPAAQPGEKPDMSGLGQAQPERGDAVHGTTGLFTYAREWERPPAAPKAGAPEGPAAALPPPQFSAPITLGQLIGFLKDPVKTCYRERLGIHYETEDLSSEDQEPFALDGLGRWSLQDELIQARLDALRRGEDEAEAVARQLARIRRRGELPLGQRAELLAEMLVEPLDRMFELYREAQAPWPQALDDLVFGYQHTVDGQTLSIEGRLGQRYGAGEHWCRIELNSSELLKEERYRRDKLLAAWVLHLASHVISGQSIPTWVIGKNGVVPLKPLAPALARQHFNTLIEAYVAGLCAPLPLAPKTGFAWLESQGQPFAGALADCAQKAVARARQAFEDGYNVSGEGSQSPYLQRSYPGFEQLWAGGEFTRYCAALYGPLLNAVGKDKEEAAA